MSTILHISDLHLGGPDAWERATDDKAGIVPEDENSRYAVIRTALASIRRHLSDRDLELSALVISGDITSQHDEEGYKRFSKLLSDLDLVKPEHTLVVPGNHDVDWASAPTTPDKYARFLQYTRNAKMRTPFCDGVDTTDGESKDQPIFDLEDCVLVAVNSANWCGVTIEDASGAKPVYDVARVSENQLARLTDYLRDHDLSTKVRLAVLHHHLLPVTEDEEAKAFESFTNLARLRAWLRDHGFHAVLHGHKHRSTLTWDHVYEFTDHEIPAKRVLVVSAPSPTSWGYPICRLIHVGEATGRHPVPHAPQIVIETINAERHERPVHPVRVTVPLDPSVPEPPGYVAIDAETADAAYEQLVYALKQRSGHLYNVTCVVRDAASAERPPSNFSEDVINTEAWLSDVVAWWQKGAPALVSSGAAPFNHGERLYSSGTALGELDAAAALLGSTKALVLLTTNSELRAGRGAPAFVAVQLVRVSDEIGDRLDCVGYFRKQDLTLWWPVNIGELRSIQKRVLDLGPGKRLRPGHLVTIAAEAIHDNVLPELAGTAVDRFVDLRPAVLMQLAYRAAHGPVAERDEINKQWKAVLQDIGDQRDFPSLGIKRLMEHLAVFRTVGGKANLDEVIKRLEAVYDRADRAKRRSETQSDRRRFAAELFELTGEVLIAVDEALGSMEDPP